MKSFLTMAAVAALMASVGGAWAAEHEVQMLNKGEKGVIVFEPDFIQAAPGDTIRFIPTNKTHNAESIPAMMPEGAEPFKGKLNQEISVTFEEEGVYGYKCMPHYAMGMVGVVVVGDSPANVEEAKAVKQPGKAKKVMAELLSKAETNLAEAN